MLTVSQAKTLTIIVGSPVGIPFNNVKLISQYILKYDPTVTNIDIRVLPGAGGVNAANHIYNVAERDGYTIGTFQKDVILKGLITDKNIRYDIINFVWLGSSSDGRIDSTILTTNKPYNGFLNIGEMNPNGSIVNLLPKLTGWNIKMIAGYPNKPAIKLALERGEVDGYLITIYAHHDRNNILAAFQIAKDRSPLLRNVPTLRELVQDKNNDRLLELIEQSNILTRPFVAPPGIPEKRKNELRDMFNLIMKDEDYIRKAELIQINVSLVDWKESIEIINSLKKTDEDLIRELVFSNPR
jgi:hypothetical protein